MNHRSHSHQNTLLWAILVCTLFNTRADAAFTRNDAFSFQDLHALQVTGEHNALSVSIAPATDLRQLKLLVRPYQNLTWRYYVQSIAIDFNGDNTYDTPAMESDQVVQYTYQEPLDGISTTYQLRVQVCVVDREWDPGDEGSPIECHIYTVPVTMLATPRVYVTPRGDALVQLRNEDCTNKIPVLIVEGIDVSNNTSAATYYALSKTLIDNLHASGHAVFFLNFGNASDSLQVNAQVVREALAVIRGLSPIHRIAVAGMSMGGVLARHALAADEEAGVDHHVGLFISYDSPQKGAHVNRGLQDWIALQGNQPAVVALKEKLQTPAAKQLLMANTYNQNSEMHHQYYDTLLARINGDGYPHDSYNVAISNGCRVAAWGVAYDAALLLYMRIWVGGVGDPYTSNTIQTGQLDWRPGSLQVDIAGSHYGFVFPNPWLDMIPGVPTPLLAWELGIAFNPVYIPTESALDFEEPVTYDGDGDILGNPVSAFDEAFAQPPPGSLPRGLKHNAVSAASQSQLSEWFSRTSNLTVSYSFVDGGSLSPETYVVGKLQALPITVPPRVLTVEDRQVTYVFDQWDDGSTENPRYFASGRDTARSVRMKARFAASESGVTWANSQRRATVETDGTGMTDHAVYASGGSIWYLRNRYGAGWESERLMSGYGVGATAPAIATRSWGHENQILVALAWREPAEQPGWADRIIYRASNLDNGVTWHAPVELYGSGTSPVVLPNELTVAWIDPPAAGYLGGVAYYYNPEVNPYDAWLIPGTEGDVTSMAVAGVGQYELAFVRDGRIYFERFAIDPFSGQPGVLESPLELTNAGWSPSNPAILYMGAGGVCLAWEEAQINGSGSRIVVRERAGGAWSPAVVATHLSHVARKPVLTGDFSCGEPTLHLVWECGDHLNHTARSLSNATWWPQIDLGPGRAPSIMVRTSGPVVMSTAGSMAPYSVNFTSSVPCGDVYPPGPVNDLSVDILSSEELLLVWSAPGDDDYVGTAAGYDIRCSETGIANDNQFGMASQVTYMGSYFEPGVVGPPWSWQEQWVTGLMAGRWYHLALKAYDEVPNLAPMSNVVSIRTLNGGGGGWLGVVGAGGSGENGSAPISANGTSDTMLVMLLDAGSDGAIARLTKTCDPELAAHLDSADVAVGVESESGQSTWSQVITPSQTVGFGALVQGKRRYVLSPRFIGLVFAEYADGSRLGDEASFRLTSALSSAGEDRLSDALSELGTAMSVGDTVVLTYARADSVVDGDNMTIGMAVSPLTGGARLRPRPSGDGERQATKTLTLRLPSPTPSRGLTRVTYAVEKRADVRMAIFDLTGRRVRGVALGHQEPGVHEAQWDGLDDFGSPARSGVYYCLIDGAVGKPQRIVLAR